MSRSLSIAIACLAAASFVPQDAEAYPLNPWGSLLAAKTASVTPYVYTNPGPVVSPSVYGAVGLGKNFDLYAGTAMSFAPVSAGGSAFGAIEIMPRYFIGGQVGVTPHILWYPGADQLVVAPEVHYGGLFNKFGLSANAGWRPNLSYAGGDVTVDSGTMFAVVAPEIYVAKQLGLFVELHESYNAAASSNSNMVAPGVWFAVDPNLAHSFSLAAQIAMPTPDAPSSVSAGMWYSAAFGL